MERGLGHDTIYNVYFSLCGATQGYKPNLMSVIVEVSKSNSQKPSMYLLVYFYLLVLIN